MLYKIKYFLILLCTVFLACSSDSKVDISVNLPIDSTIYIDIYDVLSSKYVLQDTSKNPFIQLKIDSLPAGIYSCMISWDRNVLNPAELKQYARFGEMDLPRYSLSKTLWIDPKECKEYTISLSEDINQADLENKLLNKDYSTTLKIDADGENFKLFAEFIGIKSRFYIENLRQKDSLRKVLYSLNDNGNLDRAKIVNQQLGVQWLPEIKDSLIKSEIQFLKVNINSKMFPYLYYSLISSKEEFEEYKEIYDILPPSLKPAFENHVSKLSKL